MEPITIVYGVIAGIGWALTDFVSAKAKGKEESKKIEFDGQKFLRKVIIGGVCGFLAGFTGQTLDLVLTSAYLYPVTAVADKIVTAIYRFFK